MEKTQRLRILDCLPFEMDVNIRFKLAKKVTDLLFCLRQHKKGGIILTDRYMKQVNF